MRTIDEFDIVLPVAMVSRTRQQRRLALGGADDDGTFRRAFRGYGPATVLRISSAVED